MHKLNPFFETMGKTCTVTIVGGGSSAHVLVPLLSSASHKVQLLTRKPKQWKNEINLEYHSKTEEVLKIFRGQISKISDFPGDVIPNATVIFLCMPVHQYRDALFRIGPFIDKGKEEVFLGTIYGQGGFNWMVEEIKARFDITNVVTFAVGLIPWICRTLSYGEKGVTYGCKEVNVVAVSPKKKFEKLDGLVLNDICFKFFGKGKFQQSLSFLSITLSVDNQIIHPARCYGLWKRYHGYWKAKSEVPLFYKDFDEISTAILAHLDDEYSAIRNKLKICFPDRNFEFMLDYMSLEKRTQGTTHNSMLSSLRDNDRLSLIKTPTTKCRDDLYELDTGCRFFRDDIEYGLLIAKWIGEQLNISTPFVTKVIEWSQEFRAQGEHFVVDGKIDLDYCIVGFRSGIPPSYGIKSVKDILLFDD